ncbi:MAG: PASTA domain-containing protein [Microthrixaceae bacterium]|nr:PASTA domain-containing protein [Microthrixaceae bacterium]
MGAGSGVGPVDGASGADQIDLRSSEQSSHGSVSGAGVSAGGAGSGDSESDEFGRDSIAVAEEYRALDSARPVSLGVVDPLDAAPVGATIDPDKGVGSRRGRRRRWFAAVAVLLLLALSGGAAWWFFVRVPTHTVPDWVGSQLEEATSQAESNGWVVGDPERVRRDGTTTGQVLAQNPSPGTDLSEGEPVSFTVSDGPTLTAVPSLAGMPEPEARAQIESAGLALGSRTTTFDEDVPAGSVVAASPAPGSPAPDDEGRVPKQTAIDLVVSDGPAPRVVPDGIVGVTLEEAQAALGAVQLVAEPTEEYSSSIDKGVVIRSDTAPGSELPRGSAVVLVVSAGPEPIVVPDVTGSTGTAAAAELESRGFTVSGIEGSPSGTVLATDPPAGESRLPGAQVRIFTRSG